MIDPDYSFRSKYWRFLSDYFIKFYGRKKIDDPYWVQKILINCFGLLSYNFRDLLKKERRASFYIFVHNFHENSVILWKESIENNPELDVTQDFSKVRRILKLILEEATLLDLKGTENFGTEIMANYRIYTKLLEELLYIGIWFFIFSEYAAKSKLFPNSISLAIEGNDLVINENQPYNSLYRYIESDIPNHDEEVVVDNNIERIKQVFSDSLGIDYNILGSILSEPGADPRSRFGLINLDMTKDNICQTYGFNRTYVDDFYAGLTLSKNNTLFLDQRVLTNQDNHRIVYRPILRLRIDDSYYEMIGYYKWIESLTLLSTNSIPWGIGPEEWTKYEPILKLFTKIQNYHDKILENPVKEKLTENNYFYDSNIKTIITDDRNNFHLDREGIGEIDIIYINEVQEKIIICECKHNRSRFDFNNWRRDYSNFKDSYEPRLDKKVKWASENTTLIHQHFHNKFRGFEPNITAYSVIGIFIINAPTIYMYDGNYKAYTLHDFNNLLHDEYISPTFRFIYPETGLTYDIQHPFFQNIDELINTHH